MSQEPCPTPEILAQFLDGRLAAVARREVEAHMASCEDCFEVIAGAAAFLAQERGSGEVADSGRARVSKIWPWAAAASVLLASALWFTLRAGPPHALARQGLPAWAERLEAGEAFQDGSLAPWTGGGELAFGSGLPEATRAFRLGVHFLDSAVALGTSDLAALEVPWARILQLLPPSSGTATAGARVENRAGWAADRSRLRSDLAHLAESARALDPAAFDLGAWAEAGRLASSLARVEFLESDIAGFAKSHPAVLTLNDPARRRTMAKILEALDSKLTSEDSTRLQREFERLIQLH